MGTYNSNEGATTASLCLSCPDFSTTNPALGPAANVTFCNCISGYFKDVGSGNCVKCGKGESYAVVNNIGKCVACPKGKYKAVEGQDIEMKDEGFLCQNCAVGKYNKELATISATQCISCELERPFSTTNYTGASDNSSCICKKNYFMDQSSKKCKVCPNPGGVCSASMTDKCTEDIGIKSSTICSKRGYWRESQNALTFYPCLEQFNDCTGGPIVGGDRDMQCQEGNTGILCAVCRDNWVRQARPDGKIMCTKCMSKVSKQSFALAIMAFVFPTVLLFICSLIYLLWQTAKRTGSNSTSEFVSEQVENEVTSTADAQGGATGENINAGTASTDSSSAMPEALKAIGSRFKILIGFSQIFSSFRVSIKMEWPAGFKQLMALFDFINVDLTGILSGVDACSLYSPFLTQFVYHMLLLPFCLSGILIAFCFSKYCFRRGRDGTLFSHTTKLMNMTIFLLYPGISTKVFRSLKCQKIGDHLYLEADYSVKCFVGEHLNYTVLAFICMAVYVLGIPMGSYLILRKHQKHLWDTDSEKHRGVKQKFGSLYEQYNMDCWWWEVVEMFRKLLLTGVLVMVGSGTSVQVLFGILVSLVYLAFVLKKAPYQDNLDNWLQFFSSFTVVLTLQLAFALKTDSPDEGLYEVALLDFLLCAVNTFVIFSGFLFMFVSLPCGRKFVESKLYGNTESAEKKTGVTKVRPALDDAGINAKVQHLKDLRARYGASSEEYQNAIKYTTTKS